ncbi:MAG: F510_1955 family glycosylhydrolase [Chloroflexota bacterium]
MSKKRHQKLQEQQGKKAQQRNLKYGATFIIGLLIIGGLYWLNASGGFGGGTFRDIHGMNYTTNGELYVATHDGLRVYDGAWSAPDIPINDYMGYSGTEDGFYSSGHPGAGSNLVNPIGLVRSTDYGETIQTIDFSGETDFHVMGAAYSNPDIVYVFNPAPNSKLSAGLHYSLNEGQTWEAVDAVGIGTQQPFALAVHPTQESVVALAMGNGGTYLSNDYGQTFSQISVAPVTAIVFATHDNTTLYFGYQALSAYSLEDGTIQDFSVPTLGQDEALVYVASDPNSGEIALATSEWEVYLWDGNVGTQWRQIAGGSSA